MACTVGSVRFQWSRSAILREGRADPGPGAHGDVSETPTFVLGENPSWLGRVEECEVVHPERRVDTHDGPPARTRRSGCRGSASRPARREERPTSRVFDTEPSVGEIASVLDQAVAGARRLHPALSLQHFVTDEGPDSRPPSSRKPSPGTGSGTASMLSSGTAPSPSSSAAGSG